jgi:hypothetical protein
MRAVSRYAERARAVARRQPLLQVELDRIGRTQRALLVRYVLLMGATTTPVAGIGSSDGSDLAAIPTMELPEIIERLETLAAEVRRVQIDPALALARDLRAELERRMDAEGASILKLGAFIARFEKLPSPPRVRDGVLQDRDVMAELAARLPAAVLKKAVVVKEIPARTEIRTNITYLKALLKAGDAAVKLYHYIVDVGMERRRLVVEREQKPAEPVAIASEDVLL